MTRRRCTYTPLCLLIMLLGMAVALPCKAAVGTRAQALCPMRLLEMLAGSLQLQPNVLTGDASVRLATDQPRLGIASRLGPTRALRIHDEYVAPIDRLRLHPEGVLELFGMDSDGTARNVFRLFTKGSHVSDSTRIRCRPNWHGVVVSAIADF